MKKRELVFTVLSVPLDFVALVCAALASYALRFSPQVLQFKAVLFDIPLAEFIPLVLWVSAGWLIIFAIAGLYKVDPNRKFGNELAQIFTACSTGFAAITIYIFLRGELFDSRFIVLAAWAFALLFVGTERLLLRAARVLLYHAGIMSRNVVIIGADATAATLANEFISHKSLGYRVHERYAHFTKEIGDTLIAHARGGALDEVIFTNNEERRETLAVVHFCETNHITLKYTADLFSSYTPHMAIGTVAGVPIVEIKRTPLDGWGRIGKRFFDVVGAAALLIVATPLMFLVACVILLETGGPVIFRNERVGLGGTRFHALKFRTMYQKFSIGEQFRHSKEALAFEATLIERQNMKEGPVYKIKDDPRVTPFGRMLRRSSLDELPQLWNVLRGEMSLVGPRPHQPREVKEYAPEHLRTLAVRPGITGLAQISGRSNLTFDEEARLDTFYIENWSPIMDLFILAKTPWAVVSHTGAL